MTDTGQKNERLRILKIFRIFRVSVCFRSLFFYVSYIKTYVFFFLTICVMYWSLAIYHRWNLSFKINISSICMYRYYMITAKSTMSESTENTKLNQAPLNMYKTAFAFCALWGSSWEQQIKESLTTSNICIIWLP